MIKNAIYVTAFFCTSFFWVKGQTAVQQEIDANFSLDPSVRYGKLDNGFTYYIKRNEYSGNSIELHLVVNAGFLQEDKNQLEYAHLLEHCGAAATTNFPDIHSYFGKPGYAIHASTGWDHTDYMVRVPSGDKEGLRSGLQLLHDWGQGNITVDQSLIDVQRGAVLGEMRTLNPQQRWHNQKIAEQVLRNTKYPIFNREENAESIRDFNRQTFLRYLRDWYRPDLEAAIIIGDVDVDSMEVEVKKKFADLKVSGPLPDLIATETKKELLDGKNSFVEILDTVEPGLRMYFISKRLNRAKDAQTPLDYMTDAKDQLYDVIIQERSQLLLDQYNPPFAYASFGITVNTEELRTVRYPIAFQSDRLGVVKKQFVRAMSAWKAIHQRLGQTELDNAKTKIKARYPKQKVQHPMDLNRKYKTHFVNGQAVPSTAKRSQFVHQILDTITLEDIQEYATEQANLDVNNDFVFFRSEGDKVPDFDTIKKWLELVKGMKAPPLNLSKPQMTSLEHDMDMMPRANDVEVSENGIGMATIDLPNDITLILKPSTTPSNTISINAFRPVSPTLLTKRKEYLATMLAPEVVQYMGAGSHTKFDLNDFMQNQKLRYRRKLELDGFHMTAHGNNKDVDQLMKLIHLFSTSPRRDKIAFRAWKMEKKEELMGFTGRSSSEFYMDDVRAFQYQGIPQLTLKDLETIQLDDVLEAYTKWSSSYEGYTFIVTGDFESKDLAPELISYISSLPVKEIPNEKENLRPDFKMKSMNEKVVLNNIDQAFARLYFPVVADTGVKSKALLKLISRALREKVFNRLREGCYSPSAYGEWVDVEKGIYAYVVRFDSELGNENRMIQYALEEFRELRENGVDEKWLENAIENEMASYGRQINSTRFWPGYIQEKKQIGEEVTTEVLQYKTMLEHFIDVDDVNKAAKKYLSEAHLQQFIFVPQGYSEQLE